MTSTQTAKRCKDAGRGSRNKASNTCAGRVGTGGLCHFHASMRAFEEAWSATDPIAKDRSETKVRS